MDAQVERDLLETMGVPVLTKGNVMQRISIDQLIKFAKKQMVDWGHGIGPIWDWLTSIKGLGAGGLAAQLLAQIDDIGKFATASKLCRFAGWAVIDGKIDRCKKGTKSPYNRKLKSICWLVVDQFIKQQTPLYVDIYYAEKARQRRLHRKTLCRECTASAVREKRTRYELNQVIYFDEHEHLGVALAEIDAQYGKFAVLWEDCEHKKSHKRMFNDGHLHNRAIRKTAKIFLQHVYLQWRKYEGLPISEPYVQAILGHTNIILPLEVEEELSHV